MDRGAWWAAASGSRMELDMPKNNSTHTHTRTHTPHLTQQPMAGDDEVVEFMPVQLTFTK